ncbi:unannotated protein [freshwater metagenome]|uniref:Unannotated protein n=1 Tax=freshwater metagenome TaxID=449393 RepID=A0A6J7TMH0_9ZZZZ
MMVSSGVLAGTQLVDGGAHIVSRAAHPLKLDILQTLRLEAIADSAVPEVGAIRTVGRLMDFEFVLELGLAM